jgi:hypothetical protein
MSDAKSSLSIAAGDLLFRTRGRSWDYAFVLQPEPLLGEGWYALHRRIFKNVEPESRPLLLRGTLGIGVGHPFLATAFTDAARADAQGRPVAHYFTWLGSDTAGAPDIHFGSALVRALAPALDAVFELEPEALRCEHQPLDAVLRQRFREALPRSHFSFEGSGKALAARWLGVVPV